MTCGSLGTVAEEDARSICAVFDEKETAGCFEAGRASASQAGNPARDSFGRSPEGAGLEPMLLPPADHTGGSSSGPSCVGVS